MIILTVIISPASPAAASDLIKVRLQTQPFSDPPPGQGKPKGTLYSGPIDAFRSTIRKEGLVGLFRGLSMPIFGATLENASLFFTYNAIQGQIRRLSGQGGGASSPSSSGTSSIELDSEAPLSLPQLAIAAAGAGAVTSFVLTPVELIKCRMQVQMVSAEASILAQEAARAAAGGGGASSGGAASSTSMTAALNAARRNLPGPVALFAQTVREGGLRSLWLGQTGTLLRETGGGVAWFLAFESTCRWFVKRRQEQQAVPGSASGRVTKDDLSSWQLMLAGAMAGVSYNVVLFPADSVKSTMQTQRELAAGSGKPPATLGFLGTLKSIYTTRGLAGLYAGCGITCLRSGPSSALIFLLYNRLEGWADRAGL